MPQPLISSVSHTPSYIAPSSCANGGINTQEKIENLPDKLPIEIWTIIFKNYCGGPQDLHNFFLINKMCFWFADKARDWSIRQFLSFELKKEKGESVLHNDFIKKLQDASQAICLPDPENISEIKILKEENPPLEDFIKSALLKRPRREKLIDTINQLLSIPFPAWVKKEELHFFYPDLCKNNLIAMGLYVRKESDTPEELECSIPKKLGLVLLMNLTKILDQDEISNIDGFLVLNPEHVYDGIEKTYQSAPSHKVIELLFNNVVRNLPQNTELIDWVFSNRPNARFDMLRDANYNLNIHNIAREIALKRTQETEQPDR